MTLFGTLNVSSQTLLQNQKAIDITNNNISNLNTDGYSRVDPQFANLPGMGAYVQSAKRVYDNTIYTRLILANQDKSFNEQLDNGLYQLETLFNDVQGSGLGEALDNYYNSFNDVITQPDNIASRSAFLTSAQMLLGRVRNISQSLQDIRNNTTKSLKESATRINDLTKKLTTINQQILQFQNSEVKLNEYLDERDRTLKELSSLIDIDVRYNDNQTVDVFSVKGHMLVEYDTAQQVSVKTSNRVVTNSYFITPANNVADPTQPLTDSGTLTIEYSLDGITKSYSFDYTNRSLTEIAEAINSTNELKATVVNVGDATNPNYRLVVSSPYSDAKESFITAIKDSDNDETTGFSIDQSQEFYSKKIDVAQVYIGSTELSDLFQKGSIGADLAIQKETNAAEYNLDRMVQDFAYEQNSIHRLGYNLNQETGIDLFTNEYGDSPFGLDASNITLNITEPEELVAARTMDNSADNTIAKALQETRDKKIAYIDPTTGELATYNQPAFLDGLSVSEFYRDKIVSPISFASQYNKDRLADNTFLYNALNDKMSEISGVNLDEELIKLNQLQRSYQANARVITVTDELLQTVLGLIK